VRRVANYHHLVVPPDFRFELRISALAFDQAQVSLKPQQVSDHFAGIAKPYLKVHRWVSLAEPPSQPRQ